MHVSHQIIKWKSFPISPSPGTVFFVISNWKMCGKMKHYSSWLIVSSVQCPAPIVVFNADCIISMCPFKMLFCCAKLVINGVVDHFHIFWIDCVIESFLCVTMCIVHKMCNDQMIIIIIIIRNKQNSSHTHTLTHIAHCIERPHAWLLITLNWWLNLQFRPHWDDMYTAVEFQSAACTKWERWVMSDERFNEF